MRIYIFTRKYSTYICLTRITLELEEKNGWKRKRNETENPWNACKTGTQAAKFTYRRGRMEIPSSCRFRREEISA